MKKDELQKEIIEKINREYEEFHKKFLDLQKKQQKLISEYRKRLEELKNEKYVLIEGESRRLGNLNLPSLLYAHMNNGINLLIESPIDDRVKRIVKEYGLHKDQIKQILPRFKRLMSCENFSLVNEFLAVSSDSFVKSV